MTKAYSRIEAALKIYADFIGSTAKILFGTPGAKVRYPLTDPQLSELYDSGSLWSEVLFPIFLAELGVDFDKEARVWGRVATNGVGVPSVLTAGSGIASVVKSEINQTMTFTLTADHTFLDANYYIKATGLGLYGIWDRVVSQAAGSFTIDFLDAGGGNWLINSVPTIEVYCCGQM